MVAMIRVDNALVVSWLSVLAIGTVMVASSSVAMSETYITKQGVFVVVSLLAFFFVLSVPLSVWAKYHRIAWLLAVLLCLLVLLPGVGREVNGATRTIGLGAFSLQASEVAKFLLLVYLAGYLARFSDDMRDKPIVLFIPLSMMGVIAVLLLMEPDFGSVVVLGVTSCALLFVAGARLRHFILIVTVAMGVLLVLAVWQPYRLERVITFTNPWEFAFGSGYQLTQALIAFGRGELFGLGLGEGIQKLFYLPEAHNDFIFAVIAEELGLFGAITVLVLLAFMVVRILRVARTAIVERRLFAGYLAYGVGILLGVQCLINLGVNTGVLPTKGLTLPFISYGGNSLVVCCAMLALVLRVQIEGDHRG